MDKRNERKIFSEKEVGELIKRATEIKENAHDSSKQGLTLEQVRHIAEEIGIEPEHLQAAVMEMESTDSSDQNVRFWNNPHMFTVKRVLDDTVSDDQWERIVQDLRTLTGSIGEVNELGQTKEWSHVIEDGGLTITSTQVRVRPENQRSTIGITRNYKGVAYVAYVLSFFAGVIATGITLDGKGFSDLAAILMTAGGGMGGFFTTRLLITAWAKSQQKKVNSFLNRLQKRFQRSDMTELTDQNVEEITIPDSEEPTTGEQTTRNKSRN